MRKLWVMILTLTVVLTLSGCGEAGKGEYTESYKMTCKKLKEISRTGIDVYDPDYYQNWLLEYQIQPDGHGLALALHPMGMDASGTIPMTVYETSNEGKNWTVRCELLNVERGERAFVYMGETVVLAANQAKGNWGSVIVSYDRGSTWSEAMHFHDLMDYDNTLYGDIVPYVINYNEHTGIITFGWWDLHGTQYLLINQFDTNTCQFVEEVYRSPDFPRVS